MCNLAISVFSTCLKQTGYVKRPLAAKLHEDSQGETKPVSLLQTLPESGQLFLMGSGLFVIGLIVRVIRRMLLSPRAILSIKHGTKQS